VGRVNLKWKVVRPVRRKLISYFTYTKTQDRKALAILRHDNPGASADDLATFRRTLSTRRELAMALGVSESTLREAMKAHSKIEDAALNYLRECRADAALSFDPAGIKFAELRETYSQYTRERKAQTAQGRARTGQARFSAQKKRPRATSIRGTGVRAAAPRSSTRRPLAS